MMMEKNNNISIETIDNLLLKIDQMKMVREFECPFCFNKIRIPIIARERDIEEFNKLKQIIYDFIEQHPAIKEQYLLDMLDKFLDYLNNE